MTAKRLTPEQKLYRSLARRSGKAAIKHIRMAIFPVYDNDGERNEEIAVRYSKQAASYAKYGVK